MTATSKVYRQMTIRRARIIGYRVSEQWTAGALADSVGECMESFGHVRGVEMFGRTWLVRQGNEVQVQDSTGGTVAIFAPDKILRILVK